MCGLLQALRNGFISVSLLQFSQVDENIREYCTFCPLSISACQWQCWWFRFSTHSFSAYLSGKYFRLNLKCSVELEKQTFSTFKLISLSPTSSTQGLAGFYKGTKSITTWWVLPTLNCPLATLEVFTKLGYRNISYHRQSTFQKDNPAVEKRIDFNAFASHQCKPYRFSNKLGLWIQRQVLLQWLNINLCMTHHFLQIEYCVTFRLRWNSMQNSLPTFPTPQQLIPSTVFEPWNCIHDFRVNITAIICLKQATQACLIRSAVSRDLGSLCAVVLAKETKLCDHVFLDFSTVPVALQDLFPVTVSQWQKNKVKR